MNKIILLFLCTYLTSCNEPQKADSVQGGLNEQQVDLIQYGMEPGPGDCITIINEEGDLVIAQLADSPVRKSDDTNKLEVFTYIEQMPEPPYDVNAYLAKNMIYPEDAKQDGVSGKVIVKFIIRANGSIDSAYVARGIYPSIDKEALRLITGMPPWKPGILNDKPVDVHYTMPVIFKLE